MSISKKNCMQMENVKLANDGFEDEHGLINLQTASFSSVFCSSSLNLLRLLIEPLNSHSYDSGPRRDLKLI